jgi:hypothetical protein
MNWDLWIDFHRIDEHGLTLGSQRNARSGFKIREGDYIIVGEEDAGDAVARVMKYEAKTGIVRLKVFPGSAASHPNLLQKTGRTVTKTSRLASSR